MEWLLSQELTTNINSFDHQHSTPLHLAFKRHHYDIVDLLIKQGASLNIVDQWQRTAAQLAFSGPLPVDLEDYVEDKLIGRLIAPGGQARVSVFRRRSEKATIQVRWRNEIPCSHSAIANLSSARIHIHFYSGRLLMSEATKAKRP